MKLFRKLLIISIFSATISLAALNYYSKVRSIPSHIQESFISSPIQQTKIISLPHLKGHFHSPSILHTQSGFLLSCIINKKERYTSDTWKSSEKLRKCHICLTELSHDFGVSREHTLLELKDEMGIPLFSVHQALLFQHNDELWISYDDRVQPKLVKSYLAPLNRIDGKWILGRPRGISTEGFAHNRAHWFPLSFDQELFLFSHDSPQVCLKVDPSTGHCEKISDYNTAMIWPFGTVYTHCPMVSTNEGIIGFFHSTIEVPRKTKGHKTFPVNLLGAWKGSMNDGFAFNEIAKAPLASSKQYSSLINRKKLIVPTGLSVREDELVTTVLLGDHHIQVIKCSLDALIAEMKEIPEDAEITVKTGNTIASL